MKHRTFPMRLPLALLLLPALGCDLLDVGSGEDHTLLPSGAEAFSLFGEPLYPPRLPPEQRREREEQYEAARARVATDSTDEEALIWLGRRAAYLGRFREAVGVFSRGLLLEPESPRLLRHRGHRLITLRHFDLAVEDLAKAARLLHGKPDEVEPDGIPGARTEPTSTLQFNVWYHLGLAHVLRGEFELARRAYVECLAVSTHPERLVAVSHWLYVTLRKLSRDAEAEALLEPITAELDVVENRTYHELLLAYKGLREPDALLAGVTAGTTDFATIGFGVASWHLRQGRKAEGVAVLRRVLADGQWPAFGYVAAEAEVFRMGELPW